MGTKAPQAAGHVHTDMEKGFIIAEVMAFEDFKTEGNEGACRVCDSVRIAKLKLFLRDLVGSAAKQTATLLLFYLIGRGQVQAEGT